MFPDENVAVVENSAPIEETADKVYAILRERIG